MDPYIYAMVSSTILTGHHSAPLTPAKEVAGGTLVWIGGHIYLVIGGVVLYVWKRKR